MMVLLIAAGALVSGCGCLDGLVLSTELRPGRLVRGVAAGLVLAGVGAFGLLRGAVVRRRITLGLFSAASGLYACELVLLTLMPVRTLYDHMRTPGCDRRGIHSFIDDERRSRPETWPVTSPAELAATNDAPDALLPLGNVSRANIVLANEGGQWACYDSDRFGFSNPDSIWEKPADLLVLGDSFAEGYAVPAEQGVCGWLRARGYAVCNLGRTGCGPLTYLACQREFIRAARPRVVLWLHYEQNDVENLEREAERPGLAAYLDEKHGQNLAARQDACDRLLRERLGARITPEALADERKRFRVYALTEHPAAKFLRLWQLRQRVAALFNRARPSPPGELFSRMLVMARDEARAAGARMFFVYLPEWSRFRGRADDGRLHHRDAVLKSARDAGLPVIDFVPRMAAQADPSAFFPFRTHGHYTSEGYGLLAGLIAEELGRAGIGPAGH